MTFQFTPAASVCVDPRSVAASCHRGCTSEDIYFALTGWHPGDADTENFSGEELASLVTRDAMIGVVKVDTP